MDILTIFFLIMTIAVIIKYIILKIRYKRLQEEYCSSKRERYRNSNKIVMAEYFIRQYKEKNGNAYTLARELSDLLYEEDTK